MCSVVWYSGSGVVVKCGMVQWCRRILLVLLVVWCGTGASAFPVMALWFTVFAEICGVVWCPKSRHMSSSWMWCGGVWCGVVLCWCIVSVWRGVVQCVLKYGVVWRGAVLCTV